MKKYTTLQEFYPYYLTEHQNPICRALHFIGTLSILVLIIISIFTKQLLLLVLIPIAGYGFAWIGNIYILGLLYVDCLLFSRSFFF